MPIQGGLAWAEVPMTHVACNGSSTAVSDLMDGQIQLMFENPPTVLAHVRNGRLKALTVAPDSRYALCVDYRRLYLTHETIGYWP